MTNPTKFIIATVISGLCVAAAIPSIASQNLTSLLVAIFVVASWAFYGVALFWTRKPS